MLPEDLLDRPGLAPEVRALVGATAALWRADWSTFAAWCEAARARGHDRRGLEEATLQAVLFCGFPRAITAFGHLADAWPTPSPPAGGALPADAQRDAGRALFGDVYGDNDAPVREMLAGHHRELHDFVLEAAYGRILTRPGLPAKARELVAVGVLAAMDQKRQFAGHARGARNLGAGPDEVREAVVTAFATEPDGDARARPWLQRLR